jgi:hypothetical protein
MEGNKRSLKRGPKEDLKSIITTFVKEQLENLELERKEEESMSISRISNYSAKQLESLGLCMRKLDLVEIVYSSYGKYLCEFQKRTNSDFENKISKYKFDSGDVVGLFQYGEKIHDKPLYRGIVSQFNTKKIVIAFDEEIEEESLPKNICMVQLVNQVTYDRIKSGLERLQRMDINEKSLPMVNVLFEVFEPTFNESNEKLNYIKNLTFFNDGLNESQKDAVRFALKVNEIGLIHGPPGTGKTTTIVDENTDTEFEISIEINGTPSITVYDIYYGNACKNSSVEYSALGNIDMISSMDDNGYDFYFTIPASNDYLVELSKYDGGQAPYNTDDADELWETWSEQYENEYRHTLRIYIPVIIEDQYNFELYNDNSGHYIQTEMVKSGVKKVYNNSEYSEYVDSNTKYLYDDIAHTFKMRFIMIKK